MKKIMSIIVGLTLANYASAQVYDPKMTYSAVKLLEIRVPTCSTYVTIPENSVPSVEDAYQIAYKIWSEKEERLYPQMYQLGEKAAKAGHLKAYYLMAKLYVRKKSTLGLYDYAEYKPEVAEQYLSILMQKNYSDAFYYMGMLRNESVFKTKTPASYYINQALEGGNPSAWMYMANLYIERRDNEKARPYLHCAAQNGSGKALNLLALAQNLNARSKTDWDNAFNTLWRSAQSGYYASFTEFSRFNQDYKQQYGSDYVSAEFLKRAESLSKELKVGWFHEDPYRKSRGLNAQKKGHKNMTYPALDRVLPLPPKQMPVWNGDVSIAMGAQDARYYREDYTLTRLNGMLGRRNEAPEGKVHIYVCNTAKECYVTN